MALSLRELSHVVRPKPTEPETTPSLRGALSKTLETIESYYVTPSLRTIIRELLDTAVNRKGQGYWVRAEYGGGKTHFIAAATILLTDRDESVWAALHDEELKRDYAGPLAKTKLFRVAFNLLGAGQVDAGDSLVHRFEKEISDALPADLRAKMSLLSEELAVEWYQSQAGPRIKDLIASHVKSTHRLNIDEFKAKEGVKKLGVSPRAGTSAQ